MIKIIGVDPGVYKQVTCSNCASILQYLPVDIQRKTTSDYGGGTDVNKYITCPNCSHTIYLQ